MIRRPVWPGRSRCLLMWEERFALGASIPLKEALKKNKLSCNQKKGNYTGAFPRAPKHLMTAPALAAGWSGCSQGWLAQRLHPKRYGVQVCGLWARWSAHPVTRGTPRFLWAPLGCGVPSLGKDFCLQEPKIVEGCRCY